MKFLNKYYFIVIISIMLFGCNNSDEKKELVRSIPVLAVEKKQIAVPTEYVADIRALQNVEIRARVQGYLDQILVDEGAYVEKDQILFRINDEEYKNAYEQAFAAHNSAVAEAKSAELEADRISLLVKKNVISPSELEIAKVKVMSLQAKAKEVQATLKHAEIQLSHTKIRAPFAGIINRIPFKKGSLIDEGVMLSSVTDNASVFAYFNVSENEYLKLVKTGKVDDTKQSLSLLLADGSVYPQKGTIETMAGEFDPNTGSLAFRARFSNPAKLLRHGATATVVLESFEDNAVVVPQKSTFEIQDKTFVYTVDKQNKVVVKSIVPQNRLGDVYLISSGLNSGDLIVYEGIQYVKDGMIINPEVVKADTLLSTQNTFNSFPNQSVN